jgi:hypothetical protein
MRKIALALLLIFVGFMWACDDGMDERASLGTAYVTVSATSSGSEIFDINFGRYNDNGTPDNQSNWFCERWLNLNAASQSLNFTVVSNPNSKSSMSPIYVTEVKVDITPQADPIWSLPPSIDSFKRSVGILLSGDKTIEIAIFTEPQLQLINYYLHQNTPPNLNPSSANYKVKYTFKLFEEFTGIEEEVEAIGEPLIQVLDVESLPENQECYNYE